MSYEIRDLRAEDIDHLVNEFAGAYSHVMAPERWDRMLTGVRDETRLCVVAVDDGEEQGRILGICSLVFACDYAPFLKARIPEVNALDVLPNRRHEGIATAIIRHLEGRAKALGYKTIGIGTGLYADYGPAQRLYIHLGYVPDGRGITYGAKAVKPGDMVCIDDDATLWLTRDLEDN